MLRSLLAALGLLSLIAISAVSVQAYHRDDEVVRMRVPTAGLDLTTPDGIALLDTRIDRAVRQLCDYDSRSSVLNSYRLERTCRANAYASTRRQVTLAIDEAWRTRRYAMRHRRHGPRYAWAGAPRRAETGFICRDGAARRVSCNTVYAAPRRDAPTYGARQYADPPYAALRTPEPVQYAEQPVYDGPVYGRPPRGRPDLPPVYRGDPDLGATDVDLRRQPAGVRNAVERAMVLAFQRGDAAQWRSWGARGYVTVSDPRRHRGAECRNVAVHRAILGGYETLANGLRCWTPDEGFTVDRG